jgi:hypothetical protein
VILVLVVMWIPSTSFELATACAGNTPIELVSNAATNTAPALLNDI